MSPVGCFDGDSGFLEVHPDSVTINAWADGSWSPGHVVSVESSEGELSVPLRGTADSGVWVGWLQTQGVLMISCDPTGVAPGTYEDERLIQVTDTFGPNFWNGETTVSVTVNVFHQPSEPFPGFVWESGTSPWPGVEKDTYLYFSLAEGTSGLTTQSLGLINQGGGTLDWTLTTDHDWLSVDPARGETTVEEDSITVSVDATGLTADKQHDYYDYSYYWGTITAVTNSPSLPEETIQVILYVRDDSGGSMRSASGNSP